MDISIRLETEEDYQRVEELTREAFWNLYAPGCEEHYLCHLMRGHEDFVRELDYLAEIDGRIVASIMYTRSFLIGEGLEQVPILSFGPLCVHPEYQRRGIGGALIGKTAGLAREWEIPAIAIYGDPHNYCKHGFRNGIDYKVSTMGGEYPLGLLVLELEPGFFGRNRWKLRQSEVFKYDSAKALEFDKRFAKKEKGIQYSQEIFKIQIRSFLRDEGLEIAST